MTRGTLASKPTPRASDEVSDLTRRLLTTGKAISQALAFGVAAVVASLLTFANAIQFFLSRSGPRSPRSNHISNQRTIRRLERRRRPRRLRTSRAYFVFLKYKIARRVPALIRFHHSVWFFRLKTYPRILSSRGFPVLLPNLSRFVPFARESRPPLMALAGTDLRRLLLRHSDRLGCLNQHPPIPLKFVRLPARDCCATQLARIAIVTPSYNQANYLKHTIHSVLENGYPLLQYAVVDGGSRDETRSILKSYSHCLAYWVSEPDRGQSHAIQKGFERIDGEIMSYLNADDILLPGALRLVATYFAAHPEVDVVYGHRILIDQSGLEIGRWMLPPHCNEATRRADYIPQETLFWRGELYRRIGGIDTSFHYAMDWDLILRFQAAGAIFHRLPHFLACFRVHESQKTNCISESVGTAEVELLRERELGKDKSKWKLHEHDEKIKNRALITELAAKCGYRSPNL